MNGPFKPGEYILYGTSGVCRVEDVTSSPFDKNDGRLFYVLKPVFTGGNATIYTPAENNTVRMRALMSREQAEKLVKAVPSLPALVVDLEKKRRDVYRESLATQDPYVFVSLIKAIFVRRHDCVVGHKRLPDMDNEYELLAKKSLYAELSVLLDVPFGEMEQYLSGLYNV